MRAEIFDHREKIQPVPLDAVKRHATEDFNALCKTAATAEALLKEIVPARKINARVKKILATAESKANEILRIAENKASPILETAKKSTFQGKIEQAKDKVELEQYRTLERNFPQRFMQMAYELTQQKRKSLIKGQRDGEPER